MSKQWYVNKKVTSVAFSVLGLTTITLIVTLCLVFLLGTDGSTQQDQHVCSDKCKLTLVETISQNLTFPDGSPSHMETYESWSHLLDIAQKHIDIGSYYWTMRGEDVPVKDPSSAPGEDIFNRLLEMGKKGVVEIKIEQNKNSDPEMNWDTEILAKEEAAKVITLDFPKLSIGTGIHHTKYWVVDEKHFYIGSANLDWRALTQVKEMGIMATDCGCLGRDVQKNFDAYWTTHENGKVPNPWPDRLSTKINMQHPILLQNSGLNETVYISVAPPKMETPGRTGDIDAIVNIIDHAKEFVYIALMDYFPTTLYQPHNVYWPVIDDRLRAAAFDRGVKIRLMPSWWKYSRKTGLSFLDSLTAMSSGIYSGGSIEAKLFEVPEFTEAQANIPYSRVNHNKYMVTESTAFIGTSNWSGDYFTETGGVSVIISQTPGSTESSDNIHVQLKAVFERDWNSVYAKETSAFKSK